MNKIAIAVYGGAGPDSGYIKNNYVQYIEGVKGAINAGHQVLLHKGSAINAVEAANVAASTFATLNFVLLP